MKFRALLCLLMIALPLADVMATKPVTPTPTPKPYPLRRWLRALGIDKSTGNDNTATGYKGLEFGLKVDPPQVVVGDAKQVKVTVILINRGKKFVQLDFPTSQRIEVLVKSPEGKQIEQWSEDQAFTNEPTLVTINPEERLEYAVNISTRDMVVDQTYTVEAFFPNFDQLRKTVTVAALKTAPATPGGKPGSATPAPGATPEATPAPKSGKHAK